jgi:hypothetical protein
MLDADTTAREAKTKATQEAAFQRFMTKPETKLLVSMVPQANPPEAIETLLRSSFDAGFGVGMGDTLGLVLDAMLKGDKKRDGF